MFYQQVPWSNTAFALDSKGRILPAFITIAYRKIYGIALSSSFGIYTKQTAIDLNG
jgi:hypothetical protein